MCGSTKWKCLLTVNLIGSSNLNWFFFFLRKRGKGQSVSLRLHLLCVTLTKQLHINSARGFRAANWIEGNKQTQQQQQQQQLAVSSLGGSKAPNHWGRRKTTCAWWKRRQTTCVCYWKYCMCVAPAGHQSDSRFFGQLNENNMKSSYVTGWSGAWWNVLKQPCRPPVAILLCDWYFLLFPPSDIDFLSSPVNLWGQRAGLRVSPLLPVNAISQRTRP